MPRKTPRPPKRQRDTTFDQPNVPVPTRKNRVTPSRSAAKSLFEAQLRDLERRMKDRKRP